MVNALKALNLDIEPLRDRDGRPSGARTEAQKKQSREERRGSRAD